MGDADAPWDAAANAEELEQEIELLQAMYTPDELEVETSPRAPSEPDVPSAVVLQVALDTLLVSFRFDLPAKFPLAEAPLISISRSRGLLDSEEADMRRKLIRQLAESKEIMGRYGLVDVLLLAKDLAQERNDQGGSCAICLCEIQAGDSTAFRASCWHAFHGTCFAAWWKQVESRRTEAGTAQSQATLQRKQALSAMTARVMERQSSIGKAEERIEKVAAERLRLQNFVEHVEAGGSENDFEDLAGAGFTVVSAKKKMIAIDAEAKAAKAEIGSIKAKLVRAEEELAVMQTQYDAQNELANQQGIDCPMCKLPIKYSEFQEVLEETLSTLAPVDADHGTLLPKDWNNAQTAPEETGLTKEQKEIFKKQAQERQRLFEQQKLKGGIIEADSTSDYILIDGQTVITNTDAGTAQTSLSSQPPQPASADSSSAASEDSFRTQNKGRSRRRNRGAARSNTKN